MTQPIVDILIKTTQMPATKNTKHGHFIFELPINGLRYGLKFKPSSWGKAMSQIEEIESNGGLWSMSIRGKAGKFNAGVLTIEGAGIQILEQKK